MEWKNRSAYIFLKVKEGKAQEIWQRFHNWGNLIGTWIVTGDWDVIVWIDAQDLDGVHRCVEDIKNWQEVEYTSSHMVYNGHKKDNWWWDKPYGAWVFVRENRLNETYDKSHNWHWMTSGASIPGDWDYMAWVQGENWDDVWNHLLEVKSSTWESWAQVPIKSYWNQNWKDKWW
jgi:hypothetical protein